MEQDSIVLQGPRVTLRDVRPDDVDAVHGFASDPVVTQWSTWGPNTRAETQSFVDDAAIEPVADSRNRFTLAVVFEGRVVGTAGVWTTSGSESSGELGYTLHQSVWGRGLATETAALLLDHAFGPMGLVRVQATCHPENTGSVRVLEKNGFAFEDRLRDHRLVAGQRLDSLLFAALHPDSSRPERVPADRTL
ncbi:MULTISPECIES: GNAT family N-acetyltransferase [unclassified Arthrobacter]|uniref:GNAT family N-acetyltransferase n=1 Tax=unclassified Arthrobacter TaxID=235627 RepID=UPI001E5307A0|nr:MULTISPECIES: GNAT family N-acetyltransferase [unclassified Arthrobacter]MCC9146702.1 GNAT family N-acetyltransferase [Arthrobacter sp. zg-Y919]MDK1277933.1 GNAT family N-acetyltransferase [Arthrobacter sp. zg.Y919]WIB03473.1 GNAT family N-acetyltransferase [Arthrobacter sp. zg-Y919]